MHEGERVVLSCPGSLFQSLLQGHLVLEESHVLFLFALALNVSRHAHPHSLRVRSVHGRIRNKRVACPANLSVLVLAVMDDVNGSGGEYHGSC